MMVFLLFFWDQRRVIFQLSGFYCDGNPKHGTTRIWQEYIDMRIHEDPGYDIFQLFCHDILGGPCLGSPLRSLEAGGLRLFARRGRRPDDPLFISGKPGSK